MKISIIDYKLSNLFSVKHAFDYIGASSIITSDPSEIMDSDATILPGVGAFGDAMDNLEKLDLINSIKEFISTGKPFLGICLGLQLLFSESEEFGKIKGLDIVPGKVKRFSKSDCLKVPHIGWAQVTPFSEDKELWNSSPMQSINEGEYMYFVHSYYVQPDQSEIIVSKTEYENKTYCSSIKIDNIFASQFHPEKSAKEGLKIYKNWLAHI